MLHDRGSMTLITAPSGIVIGVRQSSAHSIAKVGLVNLNRFPESIESPRIVPTSDGSVLHFANCARGAVQGKRSAS